MSVPEYKGTKLVIMSMFWILISHTTGAYRHGRFYCHFSQNNLIIIKTRLCFGFLAEQNILNNTSNENRHETTPCLIFCCTGCRRSSTEETSAPLVGENQRFLYQSSWMWDKALWLVGRTLISLIVHRFKSLRARFKKGPASLSYAVQRTEFSLFSSSGPSWSSLLLSDDVSWQW